MNKLTREEKIIFDVGTLFAELKTYNGELFDDTRKKIVDILSIQDKDDCVAKIDEAIAQANDVLRKLDENREKMYHEG